MRKSESLRYKNTVKDLLDLGVNNYCDLGSGRGEIAISLKNDDKNIRCLEAPWDFENRTKWSKDYEINVSKCEFFSSSFQQVINQKFQNFYLYTVNGGSIDRVMKLFRGKALTDEVLEYVDMGEEYIKNCNPSGRYLIWDSWMHVKEYRDYELKKIFEDGGFNVVKLFHRNNFSHWKQNIACKFWPHLGEEIIIIGQK